jgi:hypothetical protein
MKTGKTAGILFLMFVLLSLVGQAEAKKPLHMLSTLPGTGYVNPLGEQDAGGNETTASYFGQSFVMPETGDIEELTFILQSTLGPDGVDFRVLITEVIGVEATIHPSMVLFESATLTLAPGSPPTTFSVDLGRLCLRGGTTYFWILDSFVAFDGIVGTAQVATMSDYAGGEFFSTNAAAANSPTDPGTREDHFARMSPPFANVDLAFSLTYVPLQGKGSASKCPSDS